jgi:hypothetical protein
LKKILVAAAGAVALIGLSAFSVPASALPLHGITSPDQSATQTVAFRHRRVCRVKTRVIRGPHGRRVIKTRVCR